MQEVTLSAIAEPFIEKAHAAVYCTVATVDRQGRPRSRVLHPIWEIIDGEPVCWVATGRHTLKTKHLAEQPYVSVAYLADPFKPLYADCHTEWADDAATKGRIWELLSSTPPPVGYDPTPFFGAVDNPRYGVLKLTPWRLELGDMMGEARVWRSG